MVKGFMEKRLPKTAEFAFDGGAPVTGILGFSLNNGNDWERQLLL